MTTERIQQLGIVEDSRVVEIMGGVRAVQETRGVQQWIVGVQVEEILEALKRLTP
jgi:hypothetical protein